MPAKALSFWDLVILTACITVGVWFLLRVYQRDQSLPALRRQLGAHATSAQAMMTGAIAGVAFAGPLIISAQWLRGARRVHFGEVMWLLPITLYALAVLPSHGPWRLPDAFHHAIFVIWVGLQLTASFVAVVALWRPAQCWSEPMGNVCCLLVGVLLVWNLIASPL